jgi:hypothetical protein
MRTLAALALFPMLAATAAADDPPSVRAYAVNINHPPKGAASEIVSPAYTGVYLFIHIPGREIIGVDVGASKLAVSDDKGGELIPQAKLSPTLPTDKTKTQGRMYLLGPKPPSAGATRIQVKGEIAFLCGTGEKTTAVEKLPLKVGEKTEAGPFTFEVVPAKDRLAVRVRTATPTVKSVVFTDAAGKLVQSAGVLNLVVMDGKVGQSTNIILPAKPEWVGIKVVHYEKAEVVTIAVDSETGIGP